MLKTAIVGLGWWGTRVASVLKDNSKIEIIAGVDIDPGARDVWAQKYGYQVFDGFQSVLGEERVDAVILTTPHSTHEALVLQAVEAGKQIFCEKPMTLNSASAQRMVSACKKADLVLGLGHERRYEQGVEEIARLVKSGKLGTIMHVEAQHSHDKFYGLSPDSWRGDPAEAPAAGWTGMGIHLTDLFMAMVGPIDEVFAYTAKRVLELPTGDVVAVQMRFKDGTTGSISAISATPFYGRIAVFGSQGWAEARETSHPDDPDIVHFFTKFHGDERQEMRVLEPYDGVLANFEAWADAVAGISDYRFSDEERFANVAVLEAIERSAASGAPEAVVQYQAGD